MVVSALILNVLVFAALVLFLISRGYLSIYSGLFLYLAFHFIAFVQRPLAVYLFDIRSIFTYMKYMPDDYGFIQALFVANVGLFSFVFFYLAALRFQPIRPTFEPPALSAVERRSFGLAFLLLSPLIVYSFFLAFTMRQQYGAMVFHELSRLNLSIDPTTGVYLFNDTTAYVVNARNFAFPFATLLVFLGRGRWWSAIPLLFCAFVALQVGTRWPIVIAMLVLIMMVLYLHRRRSFTLTHYALMAFVLVAFIMVGHNREALVRLLLNGEIEFHFDLARSSFGEHPDFSLFECLTYIIAKVPTVSQTYSYFTQYLGLFTQPIPRMLWPGKPVGSPVVWVNLESYGRFSPLSTSIVGDGWISLGYAGVAITTGVVGALYGWLYRRFCNPSATIYYVLAYFWMLALLLQWARDGGYAIADFFFFCLSPILLAYVLYRVPLFRLDKSFAR